MRFTCSLILLMTILSIVLSAPKDNPPCRRRSNRNIEEVIKSPRPLYSAEATPKAKDWRDVDGKTLVTVVKNQHIPQYCGSCWAQAATSSLSDRIKIQRDGAFPDINISPQVVVSCSDDDGCHGGEAYSAFDYMKKNGVTDETCSPYLARGHDNGYECAPSTICKNCDPHKPCFIPDQYLEYGVDEMGRVSGEEAMMAEIAARGPIACGVAVTQELLDYKGGIFQDKTGAKDIDHDISVVGYGQENGVKFWVVRNSWGEFWGENGFFRVVRGSNNIMIESDCAWATPLDQSKNLKQGEKVAYNKFEKWHKTTDAERNDPRNDFRNGPYPEMSKARAYFTDEPPKREWVHNFFKNGEKVHDPRPQDYMKTQDLPETLDWRNKDGINFLSWNKNQHIPEYCGSCWSEGTTSALADRFNILNFSLNTRFNYPPRVALSPQAVINCNEGGSCNGGDPSQVYAWAYEHGLPPMSCQNYEAKNEDNCDPMYICRDCSPPIPSATETGLSTCRAITDYRRYYAKDYGSVRGADNMKKELTRGPIGCGIEVTDTFEKYTSGIYSEKKLWPMINHEISVVGWGVENGEEYWIGRNSWGTYWGEEGFFRMKMHEDNLGIENDCVYAVPSYTKRADMTPDI